MGKRQRELTDAERRDQIKKVKLDATWQDFNSRINGGSKNLKAVTDNHVALKGLGFNAEQIVPMVSHGGGSKNLQTVTSNYTAFMDLGFSAEQIVRMVSHDGGSKNLQAVTIGYTELSKVWSRELIASYVSQNGGSKRIYQKLKLLDTANALVSLWPEIDSDIINGVSFESSAGSLRP